MSAQAAARAELAPLLRGLKLPAFQAFYEEVAALAVREGWSFSQYLHHLAELEVSERARRRIERNLKESQLPLEKTLATLDRSRLPLKVQRQLPELCDGAFVKEAHNVLAFGLPGRGKSHVVCAIGHELIRRGLRVLFVPTFRLVQRLLIAKRDLQLDRELRLLDQFDVVILDDIGYVQQEREEMEVLFTFLAERYERRSVMITSNLVFSQWEQIFKSPMTAACAIDRLVQYSIILELKGPSYRADAARSLNHDRGGAETIGSDQAGGDSAPIAITPDERPREDPINAAPAA